MDIESNKVLRLFAGKENNLNTLGNLLKDASGL